MHRTNMRVVLITGTGPQHRYMANRLSRDLPLAAVVVDLKEPTTQLARMKRLWKRYTMSEICGRACVVALRWARQDSLKRARVLQRVLGDESADFQHPELLRYVRGINTPQGIQTIAALGPEILLIFGTGLVGSKVLGKARRVALNAHTGIAPEYRGADCAFWPLHNEELEMLGATIHECTAQVDGGKIFAAARTRLAADDCLISVFGRCVVTAADLYVRVVKLMMQREGYMEGQVQDLTCGRQYKAADRGLRAELRVRHKVRQGMIRRYVQGCAADPSEAENRA